MSSALYYTIENMTCDDIRKKLRSGGLKLAYLKKQELVDKLYKYITSVDNIRNIWNRLEEYEKEIVELYIRTSQNVDYNDIKEIMKKFNVKTPNHYFGYSLLDKVLSNSKANLFFINDSIPGEIFNQLKKYVKPVKIVFNPVNIDDMDYDELQELIIRESFEKDFVYSIRLINKGKIRVTKKNYYLTKASYTKLNEVLENKDIFSEYSGIDHIVNFQKTTRLFGIYDLMLDTKLIKIDGDKVNLGSGVDDFLSANIVEKCKLLLEAYKESRLISEIDRISESKFRYHKIEKSFKSSREVILSYLSKCPVNEWIDISELNKNIKMKDRNFLLDVVERVTLYDSYNRYYYECMNNWNALESRFIDVVLIEYLSTVGIVDVLVDQHYSDYDDIDFFTVIYFRLTKLGAYILGVERNYTPPEVEINEDTKIIVQPNFEIIVPESSLKDRHCIFFDRFAEKLSDDKASIYKLSFKSIVTALDEGFEINEIIDYLKENVRDKIPENVSMELEHWVNNSKKIKIRNITIVETDDEYLLEELKSYTAVKKSIKSDLNHAFEISSRDVKKVKKAIENKNHFCGM